MRIEQLTFTRFIAAIFIVIFHYGKNCFLFNNENVSFIFKQGNVAVSYFFVLSGFVMILAYHNKTKIMFVEYIRNRLTRIYPVYLLAIFFILGIKLFTEVNYFSLILNILMFQSWFPGKALTINFTGWSLSVEMFFYFSFPFLFNFFYKKFSLKIIAFWVVLFYLLSQIVFHLFIQSKFLIVPYSVEDINYNPLMHFNSFLIGNLAGLYFVYILKGKGKNYFWHILFILLYLLLLLKFSFGLNYHNGLLSVIFAPLIIFISLTNDKLTKLFSNKFFVFLGEISFSIYILQVPVWSILTDYRMNKYFGIDKEANIILSFFIRLAILILSSSLIYLYFEKPIRNKIRNQ